MAKFNPTEKAVWDSISNTDEQDSLLHIQTMLTGTSMMQNEPGVVYSLAVAKARPQDAQAIDQFLQEQDAEKQVTLARQSIASGQGGYIALSPQQTSLLDQTGFKYDDVLYTSPGAAKQASQRIEQLSGGKLTAVTNADGTLQTDANGNLVTKEMPQKPKSSGGGGWFDSIGSFFSNLGSGFKTAGEDTLGGLNKSLNVALNYGSHLTHDATTGVEDLFHGNVAGFGENAADFATMGAVDRAEQLASGDYSALVSPVIKDATTAQDMQQMGYDPNSIWSQFAYAASGHAHRDLGTLNSQYGEDQVNEALKYISDPTKYRENVLADPNSYVKTADGGTVLTPQAQAFVQNLQSKQFQDLILKLNADTETPGNDLANAMHINPVDHPELYNLTTAGINLAASFAVDPTNAGFALLKAAKVASLGIKLADGAHDAQKAASILTRTSHLPWVNAVQRGWQQGIDLGQQIRAATLAGDTATAGKLTAQFRSSLPALEPILDNFVGLHAFQGYAEDAAGKLIPKFEDTGGFQDLGQAADFIENKYGLTRLMQGQAVNESSLMPGALSAFGARKVKGLVAGWMSSRAASRASKAYAAVASKAAVDSEFAKQWLDDGYLMRAQPEADDAVDASGGILASPEESAAQGLASQARGQYQLTPAGEGEVARNLRATGDPLGLARKFGWASGTAIAARARLAATRLSQLQPRNTVIDLTDPSSGEKVYRYARLALDRGTSSQLQAAWEGASFGQRKVILDGLIDQVAHASGLLKSEDGRAIYARYKTAVEGYARPGNEIILNGRKVALMDGQTTTRFMLPSFDELYRESSKLGLWGATMSRAFSSKYANLVGDQWKVISLLYKKTVSRNFLEGGLKSALDGYAGDAIKTRALLTTPNRELWAAGHDTEGLDEFKSVRGEAESLRRMLKDGGLSQAQRSETYERVNALEARMAELRNRPIVQHLEASEAGNQELVKQIENGNRLAGDISGRSRLYGHLAETNVLALVGRAYRSLLGKTMDDEDINALMKMDPHDWNVLLEGHHQQSLSNDLGFTAAANEASEAAREGFGYATYRYARARAKSREGGTPEGLQKSWTLQALDDTQGADKYAGALGRLAAGRPDSVKAIVKALLIHDDNVAAKGDAMREVVAAMERESKYTDFGHVYFPDPINAPNIARTAVNDAEREAGKLDWANHAVSEFRDLLTSQHGRLNEDIANYILEHGETPSGSWIAKYTKGADRPEAALAPQTMALPAGGFDKIVTALQTPEAAAFAMFVERPLMRLLTAPVLGATFVDAWKALKPDIEKLVAEGFERNTAENLAKEIAMKNAMIRTERVVDDPGQKSQFDTVARNLFPFSRAVQAMIRRWVPSLWRNPAGARKMMLAYEAAQHAGLVYTNQYGEPTFTYPGSGVMADLLHGLAQIPGFENFASFPLSTSMTGGALMAVPGADNPFRMSMGPMISIPFREVYKHVLPTSWQGQMRSLDSFVNGPIGVGETFAQLVPSPVRRFYQTFDASSQNAAMASAQNAAIANLAAAGMIPSIADSQDPSIMQQFLDRVQTQTRNHLFLRAVFGLFAPAAPSGPSEATPGSSADFAFQMDGIKQLDAEYKAILDETGGNSAEANAVWTAMHPDELVYTGTDKHPVWELPSAYTVPGTKSTTPGASLPSTTAALDWLTANEGFVNQYKSVAAYFLPASNSGDPFNDGAYQAQLQLGLRVRKAPQEFLNDVYVKHAEATFYPTVKQFDNAIATAKMQGNTAEASSLTQAKSAWEKEFKAINPLLGAKMDAYPDARVVANGQLADLRQMVANGDTPDGLGTKLQQLITTWDNLQAFDQQNAGNTTEARQLRSSALKMVDSWTEQNLAGTPLQAVYNGVFRVLDTNLQQVTSASGT